MQNIVQSLRDRITALQDDVERNILRTVLGQINAFELSNGRRQITQEEATVIFDKIVADNNVTLSQMAADDPGRDALLEENQILGGMFTES